LLEKYTQPLTTSPSGGLRMLSSEVRGTGGHGHHATGQRDGGHAETQTSST
jgi:hypothetical protein